MLKRVLTVCALATALTAMPYQRAAAQATGDTAISITFQGIIILNYFATINLDFNSISGAEDEGTAAPAAQDIAATVTFDAGIVGTGTGVIPNPVNVVIDNAWAVRGITVGGNIQVDLSGIVGTNTAPAGSTVVTSGHLVRAGGMAGASITIPAPGFTATPGSLEFSMDVSGVTSTAAHTGIQVTITATAA